MWPSEVLALLGEYVSNIDIAARLHLSRRNVPNVLAKLGLRGRAEAVAHIVADS